MAILSLREAAQAASVTRQTIYRHAKSGKLSTVTRDDGSKGVDTSELARVYGTLRDPATVAATDKNESHGSKSDSGDSHALQGELEATKEALRMAQEQLSQANTREVRLLEVLERQSRLLEHKPAVEIDPQKIKKAGPKKLRRWLRKLIEDD